MKLTIVILFHCIIVRLIGSIDQNISRVSLSNFNSMSSESISICINWSYTV